MLSQVGFERFCVGPLQTNCYLAWDENTRRAVLIDPGDFPNQITAVIRASSLEVVWIANTHCHFDHTAGNKAAQEALCAPLAIHELDLPCLERMHLSAESFMPGAGVSPSPKPDRLLSEGDSFDLGGSELRVVHTPGHTPGSICLATEGMVFSGDTLFAGGVGRTDLGGGDWGALMNSLSEKLMRLPDDTLVVPGHGPETTIGEERRRNPFVREALATAQPIPERGYGAQRPRL
jgi:hydroxyacylglutathione hydrolase